ncbi:hypothetical protein GGX14DRAFT_430228 [Mycena pura]|uniref:Endonuclease/exonuclease/phosphatase domain-containing protein n=1 Tax=Mycena pura TaxID=153505 RepID=A0AAD6YHC9_9AGAR|nr:hypothetical protein GGX14DRAFT_430228 [Mycena pura]
MSFLQNTRVGGALSAFDHTSHRWVATPLRGPHPSSSRPADARAVGKQTLSLTSWNIQASHWSSRPVARSELIVDHILKGPKLPDIILLQEVVSSVRESLLSDPRVRSSFLTTDAEDDTAFKLKGVPFATMTLLSRKRFGSPLLAEEEEGERGSKMVLDSVFRMKLNSWYKRDALCVNIAAPSAPGTVLRLFNVHLDSFPRPARRMHQMMELAYLLREPGCSGGIAAAGRRLVALHGPDGGATWGVGVELEDGLKPCRLDKVLMLGLQPDEIEVLHPGLIDAHTPWSDHCGLRCTFTI